MINENFMNDPGGASFLSIIYFILLITSLSTCCNVKNTSNHPLEQLICTFDNILICSLSITVITLYIPFDECFIMVIHIFSVRLFNLTLSEYILGSIYVHIYGLIHYVVMVSILIN